MKKLIFASTILSCSLFAQTSTPPVVLAPFGTWLLCQDVTNLASIFCPLGVANTSTPYLLLLEATKEETIGFAFSLTATTMKDGKQVLVTGYFARNDDLPHDLIASHTVINSLPQIASAVVTYWEISANGAQVANVVMIGGK